MQAATVDIAEALTFELVIPFCMANPPIVKVCCNLYRFIFGQMRSFALSLNAIALFCVILPLLCVLD